ncbi:MAG: hypothetical protein EOO07_02825 [Chitinophagaceae bacterium]|nr:MAG: hypothetical protein EOO07_02825 [Chitinophagaceae bacterium]
MKDSRTQKTHTFFFRNSLTIVFVSFFMLTLFAQPYSGWKEHNNELAQAQVAALTFGSYLTSGHFISATFENFESEFLQMALYVLLTIKLRQIGSSESKKLDEKEEVDRMPKNHLNAPWPVKKGGLYLKIYQNSLSIAFGLLFLMSWGLHLYGSWQHYNVEQMLDRNPKISLSAYILEPDFWFETFQNWQSEFLSVAAIVFLSIYLRQKGSPESKPVDAPHLETGR